MLHNLKRYISYVLVLVLLLGNVVNVYAAEPEATVSGGNAAAQSQSISGGNAASPAEPAVPAPVVEDTIAAISNNGSRLVAQVEGTAYQWQIADAIDGTYADISGATLKHYDLTAGDESKYIRVVIDGQVSDPVGPIGKLIVFDISKGTVTLGPTYSGKDVNGSDVTGTHQASNIYVVMQSNSAMTQNRIEFTGNNPDEPFDVTLAGINLGKDSYGTCNPDTSGHATFAEGWINIPAQTSAVKKVILRLKGDNIVRTIRYYTGNGTRTTGSSLKITDINGDGATDGGALYIPEKVDPEYINEFVIKNTNYNHWNAGIGGNDSTQDVIGLHIAGGTLQVLTTSGDNCTAIGGGGNGYCQMEISGGNIVAHCNGTGAAIGGGIGWNSAGGQSDIIISGGTVYAQNHGEIETTKNGVKEVVGGVAIGSGSSFFSSGSTGKVTITGGTVEAYGAFGNGIGGGNSSTSTGGQATIAISNGAVTANSIGGGNSKSGVGGAATVEVSGAADVTLTGGIGGGDSESGNGGAATIKVTGGSLQCGGVIGGGNGGVEGDGGTASINVSGGKLTSQSVGGGVGGTAGNGGSAEITISGGVIETGSIGGGDTLNANGKLGYAKADISGGDIIGQFIMAAGGTQACTFTMTGGTLHDVNTEDISKYNYVQKDGAAVYMDDPNGVAVLSGGSILNCSAENGGAVYMTAGTFTISGSGSIEGCAANGIGGAVYLGGGTLNVQGGSIKGNNSVDGGGVYLANGTMNVTGGEITGNTASNSGGGALVNGGNVIVTGGNISGNTATNNGGGIAVNNGNFEMSGGNVDGNKSLMASGGGIYVSADGTDVIVDVLSGSVSGNSAKVSGGAVAVVGKVEGTEKINVTFGVNEEHYDKDGNLIKCEHGASGSTDCPVIENNTAETSGGAIFVTGNEKTLLNIYCLQEAGSKVGDGEDSLSNFMKMEGGKVLITTSEYEDEATQTSMHGNTKIQNTIYVTGGQMDVWGEMTNPRISEIITVDVQKEGDYFKDHRNANQYYKLLYYENFNDPVTGVTTGQYKEKEITENTEEIISGNIYNHPGYTIVGWNTDPKGEHDYPQGEDPSTNPDLTRGWYDVGKSYLFNGNPIGDLIIYAIWEAHGYTVVYEPNIPVGVTYTGKMEPQTFTYDLPIKLNKNQFGYPGYDFAGWNTEPDGSGNSYADEQEVTNLTTEEGVVVTLYAQWKECDHNPETHEYTYSVIDDGRTLKRDCSCKMYSETASLTADNTVYDEQEHPAIVTYSSENWKPEITYKKGEEPMEGIPKNAGTYTASIIEGGETASVTYTIAKADQPAPPKPEYVADIQDSKSTLKIKPVKESEDKYNSHAQYQIVYYRGDERIETEWTDGNLIGGFAASFDMNFALTNYYVYARYSESDNYNPSLPTEADTVYFFKGDVKIYVVRGEGISYKLQEADGTGDDEGVKLEVTAEEGYYLTSEFKVDSVTEVENGSPAQVTMTDESTQEVKIYAITEIPDSCVITITITGAKKLATVDVRITEKQVFGNVTTTSANISRDSAYTAYFEIHDYHDAYAVPTLRFSSVLPVGTKLILLDKTVNGYYWLTAHTEMQSIAVTEFVRMGTADEHYSVSGTELKLQLTVDFSATAVGMEGEKITTSIYVGVSEGSLAIPVSRDITALLNDVSTFELSETSGVRGLTQKLAYTYTVSDGIVSKWDNRHGALVLTPPDNLPPDAHVEYTDGVYTTVSYENNEGKFVIPLSALSSGFMDVTLVSNLFPDMETVYGMTADWFVADSLATGSPMNGNPVATTSFTFTSGGIYAPAVKIIGDKRLYSTDETVNATISWANIPDQYEVTVTLMRKSDDGQYSSTGWEEEINTGNASSSALPVPLGGQSAGSYCLKVTVMQGLIKIAETQFYFLIQ